MLTKSIVMIHGLNGWTKIIIYEEIAAIAKGVQVNVLLPGVNIGGVVIPNATYVNNSVNITFTPKGEPTEYMSFEPTTTSYGNNQKLTFDVRKPIRIGDTINISYMLFVNETGIIISGDSIVRAGNYTQYFDPVTDKSIQFDGSGSSDSDGWIMNWTWNFGDGNITTTTNETITHKYSAEGIYTVNLTVTDDDGATNTDTIAVTVTVFSMDIYLPASPTRIWVKGQGVDISTITVNATSNGTPVFGVPINFSTNLGTFIESGTKFYTNTTDINGLATVTLE